MTVKQILTEPNKILRQVSKPVESVSKEEQILMDDMLETMYAANGIGLAAIQIGVPKRIIVMDLSRDEEKKEPKTEVADEHVSLFGAIRKAKRELNEKIKAFKGGRNISGLSVISIPKAAANDSDEFVFQVRYGQIS